MHLQTSISTTTVSDPGDGPSPTEPEVPDTEPNSPDLDILQLSIKEPIQDVPSFILAWLAMANQPLHMRALETAVALFANPECSTLAELNEHRPELAEQSLSESIGVFIKIDSDQVSFRNDRVKDWFAPNQPLHELLCLNTNDLQFAIAKACVKYLSLDDFRDLPLPTQFKGFRSDLASSDPFLTYASCSWYKHVRSVDDAKALEPWLDRIIDPERNNVYLWTDQSSSSSGSGGPQHFFRSRAEIAIKYNIQWLAAHLLESTSAEPEEIFPARDMPEITRSAPSIFEYLLHRKPEYYHPSINRKIFMEAAALENASVETLQLLFADDSDLQLPAAFLKSVARNTNGDQMFEFLFSKKRDLPITFDTLSAAAANRSGGVKMLSRFFERDPSIQVTIHMVRSAIYASNIRNLQVLFEHDPDAPVDSETLESVIRMETKPENFKFILEVKPDVPIPPKVVELAVELNREGTVKLLFDSRKDLKINEAILKKAAFSHGHGLSMAEYLLDGCNPELITQDVLLAAIRRWNSPDKMAALLLKHNDKIPITDEMLVASGHQWDGKLLHKLLEYRGGQEVPKEIVDHAVSAKKSQLSWSWFAPKEDDPTLLKTLQQMVPEDPYLKKVLAETDFTPPPPKSPTQTPRAAELPDAAKTSDLARLKTLLGKGIDVDTQHGSTCGCDRNKGHGTALQRAVKQRDIEMTKLLLEHGANTDLQDGAFGNPLQEAARAGDMQIVQLLVEHKANVNLQGGRHTSPLIAAAKADAAKVVRYLIENGADINIADGHGWTPYLHALACESWDATRALLRVDSSLPALGELIALVPSRLVKVNSKSTVGISEDGLTINTDATEASELANRVLLRADHPIVPTSPFYFEISISRIGEDGIIGIGLSTRKSLKKRNMPGWSEGSWGYHGDDGHTMDEGDHYLTAPYPTFGAKDVVGCGVDFKCRSVFFTKNGARLSSEGRGNMAFHMIEARLLFPVIGVGSEGTEVTVNFGDSGAFVYQG